jgi:hypothetical protein
MTYLPLKKTLILAIVLAVGFLAFWEYYCRMEGNVATMEGNKALWAQERSKVRDFDREQVLIVGASRAAFDFQLNEWEEVTGIRPLMLASPGQSPLPVFKDLVENTNFTGTMIINVTPGSFFLPDSNSSGAWRRAKVYVDHYYERTYAQRLNHKLSYIFQKRLAYLTAGRLGDPDLKSLIKRIPLQGRIQRRPTNIRFAYTNEERNVTMLEKVSTDTAFAKLIQNWWTGGPGPVENRYEDLKEQIFDFYFDLISRFKDRGGKIIFTRNPSHGLLRKNETIRHPREEYWDKFIEQSACPGYHFEDFPVLSQFYTPEWSHLATDDAKIYTREILEIMIGDGYIQRKL